MTSPHPVDLMFDIFAAAGIARDDPRLDQAAIAEVRAYCNEMIALSGDDPDEKRIGSLTMTCFEVVLIEPEASVRLDELKPGTPTRFSTGNRIGWVEEIDGFDIGIHEAVTENSRDAMTVDELAAACAARLKVLRGEG